MQQDHRAQLIQQQIWEERYRISELNENTLADTFERVARHLSAPEGNEHTHWYHKFLQIMLDKRFIPGGRILANAGRGYQYTLANCFVSGTLSPSMESVFYKLTETLLTLQSGGGVGIDFSPLPHRHPTGHLSDSLLNGPAAFLNLWDRTSETLCNNTSRHSAMMGVLDCSHPDIMNFIEAKQSAYSLQHFNLSVLITDAFMQTLNNGGTWPLRYRGDIIRSIPAEEVWQAILKNNLTGGEPGVLFIDTINRSNRLAYKETIRTTNPCGELPLPPHGSCILGSLVLPHFVEAPFTAKARINLPLLESTAGIAVRLLDNALEKANLPLSVQQRVALRSRRIGLGITGLADLLVMLGLAYDSPAARAKAIEIIACIRHAAYDTSCELAKTKGSFPVFDAELWIDNEAAAPIPAEIASRIRKYGIRNSHLTAIAPTGSISLLADNVSPGIEPIYGWYYTREHKTACSVAQSQVRNYALQTWEQLFGNEPLPDTFYQNRDVPVTGQVDMLAALQPYVDSGISKTVNLPEGIHLQQLDTLFRHAYSSGLKGLTSYPATAIRGSILNRGCGDR